MSAEIPDDKDPAPPAVAWPSAEQIDATFDAIESGQEPEPVEPVTEPAVTEPVTDPAAPPADPELTDEELAAAEAAQAAENQPDPNAPPAPPVPDPNAQVPFEELPAHWQGELTKARNEAADYRVRAKEFHEAFDGYSDEQRSYFLDLAKGLAGDDASVKAAAGDLLRVSKAILEAQGVEVGELAAPDPNAPMTVAEFERRQAEAARERETARLIEQIDKEIEGLGYEKGSTEHSLLLVMANQREDGSIEEASKQVQAYNQRVISDFIKAEREKRQKHITTAPAVGTVPAPPAGEPPKTLEEAGRLYIEHGFGEPTA